MTVYHLSAAIAGREVFYREAGRTDAPTIVLLHGSPASSFMFRELIGRLADRYHVIAPDYVGFGFSAAPPVTEFTYTFDALTDHIDGLLTMLGVERYAIYTHDYGAPVGWRLALRHPDRIAAIVTQNGNAYEEGFVEKFWAPVWRYAKDPSDTNAKPLRAGMSLERIRWQYTHGVPDPSVVSPDTWTHDHAMINRPDNPEIHLALSAQYPTNVALYPEVQAYFRATQVPLLAVWGRGDEIFGPDGARAFARDLREAEIHLLDGGHFLLESQLDEVTTLIRDFLARNWSGG